MKPWRCIYSSKVFERDEMYSGQLQADDTIGRQAGVRAGRQCDCYAAVVDGLVALPAIETSRVV
jgi:hypothetical protein